MYATDSRILSSISTSLFQSFLLPSHFKLSLGIWDVYYFKHHISLLLKKLAHPERFQGLILTQI